MSENLKDNPFAQLFPSLSAAQTYSEQCESELAQTSSKNHQSASIPQQYASINDRIEKLFGIGFNENTKNAVVYLKEVANECKQSWIDLNTLEQALFERLLLENPEDCLLNRATAVGFVIEKEVLTYLFECYRNITDILESQKTSKNENLHRMIDLILRNISTALKQPDLYVGQNLDKQLFTILALEARDITFTKEFLNRLVDEITKDEDNPADIVSQAFLSLHRLIDIKIENSTISNYSNAGFISVMHVLAHNELTADAMIEYNTRINFVDGAAYEDTMFGAFLSLSCLPRKSSEEYLFFKQGDVHAQMETVVWAAIEDLQSNMHKILFQFLKLSETVKQKTIAWLTNCLLANVDRGKLLNTYRDPFHPIRCVSDAFMLNLSGVVLRLCEPIIVDRSGQKMLKIDPTYGAAEEFLKDTYLVPCDDPQQRPIAKSYNFVTKIFFLSHQAITLGFSVCQERLTDINQKLSRMYTTIQETSETPGNDEGLELLRNRFAKYTSIFLSLKAVLLQPKYQNLLFDLNVTTCKWLVQVMLDDNNKKRDSYMIETLRQLTFPLNDQVPLTFTCIPELLLENLNSYLPFCKKLNSSKFEERGMTGLEPFVTCILVLTRGNRRVKNPHLRAGLAESLEALLPNPGDQNTFARRQVFQEHPHCREIVQCLLDVFVTIEMTGESVQDYKFKYRRAIYAVMEFLWTMDVHKDCFKELATIAEQNMEAVNPPLFLRFLNLLINDAVYLLDEVLSKMAELKNMQTARSAGEWERLPAQERSQMMANYQHTGLIARSNNILSKCTIKTLQFLTEEIKIIFSHPTMVDRMAGMLNHFLNHLVGPNKKNLKVMGQDEFEFLPGDIVLSICHIYANLSGSDAFCLAISQDGRSYNKDLFLQAEEVLFRIGGSALVPEIRSVASRVSQMAQRQKNQEELLADAPEDFLDPIMSTIMTDPVVLPTSHVTVDRTTIARHLLSDQSDPFNRSPLTMEMVTPNEELKLKITAWMMERKQGPSTGESTE